MRERNSSSSLRNLFNLNRLTASGRRNFRVPNVQCHLLFREPSNLFKKLFRINTKIRFSGKQERKKKQRNNLHSFTRRHKKSFFFVLFIILYFPVCCLHTKNPSKYLCMNENIELDVEEEEELELYSIRRRGLFRVICCLLALSFIVDVVLALVVVFHFILSEWVSEFVEKSGRVEKLETFFITLNVKRTNLLTRFNELGYQMNISLMPKPTTYF